MVFCRLVQVLCSDKKKRKKCKIEEEKVNLYYKCGEGFRGLDFLTFKPDCLRSSDSISHEKQHLTNLNTPSEARAQRMAPFLWQSGIRSIM